MFTEARFSTGKNGTSSAAGQRSRRSLSIDVIRKKASSGLGSVARKEFEALISDGCALITFYADWCAPCRGQKPVIDELAEVYREKATIANLNIDQNQFIAMQLEIQSIPTTILFRKGRELDRFIGFQTMETLSKALTDAFSTLSP